MTAHTPGPWLYRHKNDGVYTAPPEGTNYTYGELIFAFNEDFSPPSSDLPLILAAPELLEALTKAVRETEQCLFDAWLVRTCPSGDVESVHRQWMESSDHREFIDEWREQIDAIAKATGAQP